MNVVTAIVNSAIDVMVEKNSTGRTASSKACFNDESFAKSRADSTAVNVSPVAIACTTTYTQTAIENTDRRFDGRRAKAEKLGGGNSATNETYSGLCKIVSHQTDLRHEFL